MSEPEAATFVFTDLVGSTALASAVDRETAEQLRETHFALLRSAVAATGGLEVKGLGDGLMVRFTSPTRGLACGVAMQQAIERHNRRSATPLAIRVGMATGEATEADGDYYGDAVVEAARLCGEAAGGQILITDLLRRMVGRHATQEMTELGARTLKGLPEPVAVVEVQWDPEPETANNEHEVPLPNQLLGAASTSIFAFFGRAAELAAIDQTLKDASAEQQMQAILIAGEPGVGKTWLASQAARAAHARGTTVLFGGSVEGFTVPYRPWITALSHLVAHLPPDALKLLTPVQAGVLGRLLPNEANRLPDGEPATADPDTERLLLMDAVVSLLHIASAASPTVIVLDDLQWADVASLQLFRHLLASGAPLALTVVATFRDSELSRDAPLTALLADLRRQARVARVRLGGLDDHDVVELIEAAAGYELDDAGVALAHAVHSETDGNPFFVTELLRHLAESGEIAPSLDGRYGLASGIAELDLPRSIREVVAHRVARLGEGAVRVLSLAAVIGQTFDVGVLTAVAGVDDDELLDVLDAAVAAALISEDSSMAGRYRFAHALIQHTLYQDTAAARRQRAHLRVAQALEETPSDRLSGTGRSAALAYHWLAATQPADAAKALEYTEQAAEEALNALAPQDAARWYGRALELTDRQRDPNQLARGRLLVGLATAEMQAGDPTYRSTLREAGRLARALGDRDLLVAAAVVRTPGIETILAGDPEQLELLHRALDVVGDGDSPDRARLLAALADETDQREGRRRFAIAMDAIAVARRCGDRGALLEVLLNTMAPLQLPDTLYAQDDTTAQGVALATSEGDLSSQVLAIGSRMNFLGEAARIEEFDVLLAEVRRIAALTRLPWHEWNVANYEAWRALFDGQIDDSLEFAERVREIGTRAAIPPTMASYGAHTMMVHVHRGTPGDILGLAEQAASQFETLAHGFRSSAMWLCCEAGQLEQAEALFDQAVSDGFEVPFDKVWLQTVAQYAETAAVLERIESGAELYDMLVPFEGRFFFSGSHDIGAIARQIGRVAQVIGRADDAERHYRAALDLVARINNRYWIARTELDLAELLQAKADGENEARSLAAKALQSADEYGYGGLSRRASAVLEPRR